MNRVLQSMFFASCLAVAGISTLEAEGRVDCTLEPTKGSKRVELSEGITAEITWSSCTSMGTDIVFSPVSPGLKNQPDLSLRRAAQLTEEIEIKTGDGICPFEGSVPSAFAERASADGYKFGESIPVSNTDIPGWDGAFVIVREEKNAVALTVRYWANP